MSWNWVWLRRQDREYPGGRDWRLDGSGWQILDGSGWQQMTAVSKRENWRLVHHTKLQTSLFQVHSSPSLPLFLTNMKNTKTAQEQQKLGVCLLKWVLVLFRAVNTLVSLLGWPARKTSAKDTRQSEERYKLYENWKQKEETRFTSGL